MVFVGLLIPLGVGVLAAMELRAPVRSASVVVDPVAETVDISDSHVALAKADRLDIAAASSETPAQPALVDERISPPEGVGVGSSEPPVMIVRHRHDSKLKKAAAARPRKVTTASRPESKRKTIVIKRAAISERRKSAGNTEFCRLSAFGGLRKALNSVDCEI
jgi:hypothetical protein